MIRLLPIAAALFLAAPALPTQAAALPVCGTPGLSSSAACFLDYDGDRIQDASDEVCSHGTLSRGGIGCAPAPQPAVVTVTVVQSLYYACSFYANGTTERVNQLVGQGYRIVSTNSTSRVIQNLGVDAGTTYCSYLVYTLQR